MSCTQCGSTAPGGRFCVGCGRRTPLPVAAVPRPRSPLADEPTQPVLRLERRTRPAVPAR